MASQNVSEAIAYSTNREFHPCHEQVARAIEDVDETDTHTILMAQLASCHAQAQQAILSASQLPVQLRGTALRGAAQFNAQVLKSIHLLKNYAPLKATARIGYKF